MSMNRIGIQVSAFCICAMISACAVSVPVTRGSSAADFRAEPEDELRRHADAMTRSGLEGAAIGAAIGGVAGLAMGGGSKTLIKGVITGGAGGLAAGGYVGFLQKKYSTNEQRLDRLRTDVDEANRNALASIQTMERVLANQNKQLETARSGGKAGDIGQEVSQARENQNQMALVVAGYERRRNDFASTRSLKLVNGQNTGVDQQIIELDKRISAMRQIANTMATSI